MFLYTKYSDSWHLFWSWVTRHLINPSTVYTFLILGCNIFLLSLVVVASFKLLASNPLKALKWKTWFYTVIVCSCGSAVAYQILLFSPRVNIIFLRSWEIPFEIPFLESILKKNFHFCSNPPYLMEREWHKALKFCSDRIEHVLQARNVLVYLL